MSIGFVPFTFANQAGPIPLEELDANLSYVSSKVFTVVDEGADPTGLVDASPAFAVAAVSAVEVIVPGGGTFKLDSTPIMPRNLLVIEPGAVLTGAGAPALGYAGTCMTEEIQLGTTGGDFATKYIRRMATHTGGVPGWVSGGLKVETYVSDPNATNYEWALVAKIDSASDFGQNTGIYGQAIKRADGALWACALENIEVNAVNDPPFGQIGLEIAMRSNGTDALNQRVALDIVATRWDGAGAATEVSYGSRIQSGADPNVLVKIGHGFDPGTKTAFAFDAAQATVLIAAVRLADGQAIAWDAAAARKTFHDATGLAYFAAGGVVSRLTDAGGIELKVDTAPMVIAGTTSTGAAAPVLTANKPGAGTAIAAWMSITISGTQYWSALWSN